MAQRGMKFGVFLAPFHRLGDNPTLAMARDLELLEWLDHLGYDEAWIGEHHSAGWEIIALPELIIAAAAERTRHIKLGSGVTSLPYHHPFLVAQRFVQLDHMTRGRVMLGCGPGALPSDAYMMGIEPVDLRRRMEESLDAIIRLLRVEEPVTMAPTGSSCARRASISRPIPTRAFTSPSPARSPRSAWSRRAATGSACCRSAPGSPGGRRRWRSNGGSPRRPRPSTAPR